MAINKKAKAAEAEKTAELQIEVTRAHDFSDDKGTCISFDMVVNGIVTIYGCYYREGTDKNGKEYAMVAMPSKKGSDGKYYKHAYVKLTDDDIDEISKQIETML